MSLEAIQRGVAGVVVDGAVRDVRHHSRAGPARLRKARHSMCGLEPDCGIDRNPIVCGGVIVRTGDLIIADDGVVVVPEERIEEVLQRIAAIVEKEKGIAEKVRSGAHIADLLGMSDAIAVSRSKGQTE